MKYSDRNYLIDVMNGRLYTFEKDTFNLVLFADAAAYNKSGNKSMYAIFSEIVELPPFYDAQPKIQYFIQAGLTQIRILISI